MTMINSQSFISNYSEDRLDRGTVEITLRNETKRVPAIKYKEEDLNMDGLIVAKGIVGKYRTGKKLWPANIVQHQNFYTKEITESVNFGRDDRSSNFQKQNNIWFK